jgi:ABC-type oligopeptide transport system substrate-binding subunit
MRSAILLLLIMICFDATAGVYRQHAYSLYGQPRYAENFEHLEYVNPNAPKGGASCALWDQAHLIPSIRIPSKAQAR